MKKIRRDDMLAIHAIDEAEKAREDMDASIREILEEFTLRTGLLVYAVDVQLTKNLSGDYFAYFVNSEVRI